MTMVEGVMRRCGEGTWRGQPRGCWKVMVKGAGWRGNDGWCKAIVTVEVVGW